MFLVVLCFFHDGMTKLGAYDRGYLYFLSSGVQVLEEACAHQGEVSRILAEDVRSVLRQRAFLQRRDALWQVGDPEPFPRAACVAR